jgi:hypothetical protein
MQAGSIDSRLLRYDNDGDDDDDSFQIYEEEENKKLAAVCTWHSLPAIVYGSRRTWAVTFMSHCSGGEKRKKLHLSILQKKTNRMSLSGERSNQNSC